MGKALICALPTIRVSSMAAAEAFYCGKLGFALDSANRPDPPAADPAFVALVRDGVWVHLSSHSGDGVFGSVVAFAVRDVDALYAEFAAKGVVPSLPPTDQTWGNREMYVRDPDGNAIRFLQFRR